MKRLENLYKLLRLILSRDHKIKEIEELLDNAYEMGKIDGAREIIKEMIIKLEK